MGVDISLNRLKILMKKFEGKKLTDVNLFCLS